MLGFFFSHAADVKRVNAEIMTAKESQPWPNLRTEEMTRGGTRLELRGVLEMCTSRFGTPSGLRRHRLANWVKKKKGKETS